MPDKRILLYDDANTPLQVKGIRVELYDAATHGYVDGADSDDLKPAATPSNTWGVVLKFPPGKTPLDVLISDPSYNYPGNTMQYLNGDLGDEVLMDLLQLPAGPGGQSSPPDHPTIPDINKWIDDGKRWSTREKAAARNLVFNYARLIAPILEGLDSIEGLREVAANWETALERLGFPPRSLALIAQPAPFLAG